MLGGVRIIKKNISGKTQTFLKAFTGIILIRTKITVGAEDRCIVAL